MCPGRDLMACLVIPIRVMVPCVVDRGAWPVDIVMISSKRLDDIVVVCCSSP